MYQPETQFRTQGRVKKRRGGAITVLVRLLEIVPAAALLIAAFFILFPASPNGGEDTTPPPATGTDAPADPGTEDTAAQTEEPTEPPYTDQYTPALLELAEKNPEAAGFVAAYAGATPANLKMDLTEELSPGQLPYFTQWDSRWGYNVYGSGLMGWTGCGPTVLSMVAVGLTGDGTLTPAFVADMAIRDGYCVKGDGTAWTLFSQGSKKLGLSPKELPLWEPTVRAELEAGRPVVCVVGPGHFTEYGHYILLTKADAEGYHVLDPFRPSNCHAWSWDDFSGEIRNLWSFTVSE